MMATNLQEYAIQRLEDLGFVVEEHDEWETLDYPLSLYGKMYQFTLISGCRTEIVRVTPVYLYTYDLTPQGRYLTSKQVISKATIDLTSLVWLEEHNEFFHDFEKYCEEYR